MMATTKIRYIGQAGVFRVAGSETGEQYVFAGQGSVQRVNGSDVDALLAMVRSQSGCCGGAAQEHHLFATV